MKTFIALTFIGILTYAYAELVTIKECKNVTAMDDFSATTFFQGQWYVTHVKNVTSPTVCQTFDTSQEGDKLIVKFGSNGKDDGTNNEVRCEATKEEENAKIISFGCTANGESIFQANFIVMCTDYDDYAVFYRCITFEGTGSKADNYLVLRRTGGNEKIPNKAKSLTEKLELKKCSEITQSSCL
uniref:Putative salivary lipocalin lipocalin n=1 Tax=Panstrongylus lignarius TaxID=156445 RepID=A0A224XZ39_9HEMI